MTRTVLVTGAGGKTGRAVVRALLVRGARPRVFVRDPARARDIVTGLGLAVGDAPVEVAVGDQREVEDLAPALEGVAATYAIAPNVSPDEVVMGRALLAACHRTDVGRLVQHSVVHPQLAAMPHHADKGRVEELVVESGLDWTILQPNAYLQNVTARTDDLRAGTYQVPYATDVGLAMVDLDDVAEVAARALLDDVGVHATFELSGPEELTAQRVAEVVTATWGVDVHPRRQDPDAWANDNADLPEAARSRLHAMFAHYDRHGSPGDATVLAALLGRRPRTLADLLTAPHPTSAAMDSK